ncbi:MAG TPA: hypothetical protein VE309_14880, partial [Caulobacteraceae bacterium]|nr:hypothetical protein [Caulobacteraceae bacterium]
MARENAPIESNAGSARTSNRLSVLLACVAASTVILAGFTLWALRHILTPVALAVFLLLLIDGLARVLARRIPGLRRFWAMVMAVVFIVVLFGGAIWMAADNGAAFAARSPDYQHRLNILLNEGAARLNLGRSITLEDLIHQANPARFVGAVASRL